jgi:hypothetical protein
MILVNSYFTSPSYDACKLPQKLSRIHILENTPTPELPKRCYLPLLLHRALTHCNCGQTFHPVYNDRIA